MSDYYPKDIFVSSFPKHLFQYELCLSYSLNIFVSIIP